ncbi:YhcH/YjgK/YiaL family protein [uncultured Muribaculum sp.]|uniref:YhcH/YjgK/YiaL family protein n=1 Tax=uncultured Muribaculum sp. TaxID=1918613 RepID=UPI00266F2FE2|nr:YhcH/YjgK/YiaL family protein [uncultured Muribaculum sp.]
MEKQNLNEEEARKWVESRQWDNGWTVMPDSTVNNVEFAAQYAKNKELWDKLLNFIANTDLKSLEPGKVVLVPGRLWINVMAYTPKSADETAAEVHRKYIDLQYTFEGNELMGLVNKVTPTGDYDVVKDVQKFTPAEPVSYVPAAPDRFFLYFPSDIHQPSVASCEQPGMSRKIVGKIEVAQ